MLTFNTQPPTAETTDVKVDTVHTLVYGSENRCINGVAEVCAAMVLANTTDVDEALAIGQKVGDAIATSETFGSRAAADGRSFTYRYTQMLDVLIQPNVVG